MKLALGLPLQHRRWTPRTVVIAMLTAVLVLGGVYVLWQVRDIAWCVIALFVAVALNPAVNWLERARIKRSAAIFVADAKR